MTHDDDDRHSPRPQADSSERRAGARIRDRREPPGRLLLAWQITSEWRFDPTLVSELEVRFIPEGAGTLVELEHRLEGYGAAAAQVREIFDGPEAWMSLLERFAQEAQ